MGVLVMLPEPGSYNTGGKAIIFNCRAIVSSVALESPIHFIILLTTCNTLTRRVSYYISFFMPFLSTRAQL
jgi:hypothetical protein